jgi:hypothetical protein
MKYNILNMVNVKVGKRRDILRMEEAYYGVSYKI